MNKTTVKRRLKRIHVNQHVIKRNRKLGEAAPPLTVKVGRENHPAHSVEIFGPSSVVYSPDQPLSCGARVWIETKALVRLECQGEPVWIDVGREN